MERNCDNCKYRDVYYKSPPCDECNFEYQRQPQKGFQNWEPDAMTNADRVRSMTDAELANRIVCHVSCSCCPLEQEDCKKHCYELWLEWLRKEAE